MRGLPDEGGSCRGQNWNQDQRPLQHPLGGEVLIKKRALLCVKQQVSALMHGEDLPEGALARETAEVPYQLPAVAREATDCPVCERKFITHHHMMKHMGVHHGEKFPCDRCNKVLASRKMLKFHQSSCVRGRQVSCPVCAKPFGSKQVMLQHHKVAHGMDQLEMDETFSCPFCNKNFNIRKSMWEHCNTCISNLDKKGPFFCHVAECPRADHPFSRMKNLNHHLSGVHGWAE